MVEKQGKGKSSVREAVYKGGEKVKELIRVKNPDTNKGKIPVTPLTGAIHTMAPAISYPFSNINTYPGLKYSLKIA